MCIFIVDKNKFGTAVLQNVGDFVWFEPYVDRAKDRAGSNDTEVSICVTIVILYFSLLIVEPQTCYQGSKRASKLRTLRRTKPTYEFGAITATRSPGLMPDLMSAYARF